MFLLDMELELFLFDSLETMRAFLTAVVFLFKADSNGW